MTHIATMVSIYGSIISIVSGILCTWLLVGSHATNLKVSIMLYNFVCYRCSLSYRRVQHLLRHRLIFYYLYATPSLFGGASALTFFVAVGSWTWLDQAVNDGAWAGRIFAVLLSATLMANAGCCFVLGGRKYIEPSDDRAAVNATPH